MYSQLKPFLIYSSTLRQRKCAKVKRESSTLKAISSKSWNVPFWDEAPYPSLWKVYIYVRLSLGTMGMFVFRTTDSHMELSRFSGGTGLSRLIL